jgi:hypothetical protein
MDLNVTPEDFPYAKQIEEIFENLDDLSIVLAMEQLDIRWPFQASGGCGCPDPVRAELRAPTRAELRSFLQGLLEERARAGEGFTSTAGFLALKCGERLSLYFAPYSSSAIAPHDTMTIIVRSFSDEPVPVESFDARGECRLLTDELEAARDGFSDILTLSRLETSNLPAIEHRAQELYQRLDGLLKRTLARQLERSV